ncbi:hypothetical protein ACFVUS_24240 [Nocardia sp. NPDC058058]|uniref:hypothetical protein n=1 Tax=Nocardia sp. NPDC058058 TaxID=3346317 RepID=UPI0036DE688F
MSDDSDLSLDAISASLAQLNVDPEADLAAALAAQQYLAAAEADARRRSRDAA